MSKYEKIKIFLLGILVAIMFMFLSGASGCSRGGGGRYQIATLAGEVGNNAIFVLDTATGVVSEIPIGYQTTNRFYYPDEFPEYQVDKPK